MRRAGPGFLQRFSILRQRRMAGAMRGALLLSLLACPPALRAQFQAPTAEELKMTSDPKAPGAAAVYLYREEDADNSLHEEVHYVRIKVLTEKGKELATVRIPYLRGYDMVKIEGRTIHSDGTVIPLNVKPEDLVEFKDKYFQEDMLVFTLPSVEVGSILEYRVEFHLQSRVPEPRWEIQEDYFTRKAHFSYQLGKMQGLLLGPHGKTLDRLMMAVTPANAPIPVQHTSNAFTLDMTDVPPVPGDDWMPPINTIRWRVEFYYTYARTGPEFWDTERKFWAEDTENFIHVSGTIKKAAASIVAPGDSDEQKARKIYVAVTKLDNTDFSRVKSHAERKKEKLKDVRSVEDVWKNQSGAGNSIALLYVALARAAGLRAWPMEVADRNISIFDVSYLDTSQLNDYLAVVNTGGQEKVLDPGQKVCPFGSLHWAHTLAGGFRESDAGTAFAQTPASTYKENTVQRSADLTLEEQGNLKGTARVVLTGAEALYWRQLSLENSLDEVKKEFEESMNNDLPEGVEAHLDHFLGMDDPEANLMAVIGISGRVGFATGKRYFLPGLFFETRVKHPFVAQDKRTTPIDVHNPRMERDDVTFHLPAGYAIEGAPSGDVKWPGFAVLHIGSVTKGDTVEVVRVFGRNFTLLGPESYNDLHDFYLKLAAADQQQIVLKRAAAAKGN